MTHSRSICSDAIAAPWTRSSAIESTVTMSRSITSQRAKRIVGPTAYIARILNANEELNVKEIIVLTLARIRYSTTLANLTAWIADRQPSPTLLVMPGEVFCRKVIV